MASYTLVSPWGWYVPSTSPTTVALLRCFRSAVRLSLGIEGAPEGRAVDGEEGVVAAGVDVQGPQHAREGLLELVEHERAGVDHPAPLPDRREVRAAEHVADALLRQLVQELDRVERAVV